MRHAFAIAMLLAGMFALVWLLLDPHAAGTYTPYQDDSAPQETR